MDMDDILRELGQFGRYQIYIFIQLFFLLVYSSIGTLTYVFTAGDIEYRCVVPECEKNNDIFQTPWITSAIPFKNGLIEDKCTRYVPVFEHFNDNCTDDFFYHNKTERCESFIYKTSENTITKEFNLLCRENEWKRTIVGTLNNVAQFIGMPLAGVLSDRFGRKRVILTLVLLSSLLGTLRSFSANYYQFITFEMLDSCVSSGIYCGVFVLGIEFAGPEKRSLAGVIISCYYSMGEIVLGIIVWLIQDWRIYLRVIYLPGILSIGLFWLLPESMRWLITNGKRELVEDTLKKLSRVNRRPMTEEIRKSIQLIPTNNKTDQNTETNEYKKSKKLMFSRTMALRVLNCSFCWITHTFVFYGLSLNSVSIAGNKYFNFILVSMVEIPAYILSSYIMDALGRKMCLFTALILSGISCTAFHFITSDMETVRLAVYLVGKSAITVSFSALYVLASELFPTANRHTLMGFCSTLGRIGSMVAPLTPLMAPIIDPVIVFGVISFVAAALTFYFPETLNTKLPDTIEEATVIGKEEKK